MSWIQFSVVALKNIIWIGILVQRHGTPKSDFKFEMKDVKCFIRWVMCKKRRKIWERASEIKQSHSVSLYAKSYYGWIDFEELCSDMSHTLVHTPALVHSWQLWWWKAAFHVLVFGEITNTKFHGMQSAHRRPLIYHSQKKSWLRWKQ